MILNKFNDYLNIIDLFLENKIKYADFYSKFNDIFSEYTEGEVLKQQLVWDINDKLAYTSENPDNEERSYGYVSSMEFKEWLQKRVVKFNNDAKN